MHISQYQFDALERAAQVRQRREVGALFVKRTGSTPTAPSVEALDDVAQRTITAAQAVRILDWNEILRFSDQLFRLHAAADERALARFTKVMLSEQTSVARLDFVERHLLPMPSAKLRTTG
ncbi:MAG: hypothetical protein ACTHL8_06585 [Burkholderiaceae bacterium]